MVGSALVLLAVLMVLRQDRVLGLALFLAAAALFLENRRRMVNTVRVAMVSKESVPAPVEELSSPAPDLVAGEVHPRRDSPEFEDHGFEPADDSGSNGFQRVAPSQNEKEPLETMPPHPEEVSEFFQSKGLGSPFEATNSARVA